MWWIAVVIALLLSAGVLLLFPAVTTDAEHPAAMCLKGALGLFKDRNGFYPEDLRAVQPELEEITRSECRINAEHGYSYLIDIAFGQRKKWRMKVEYRIDSKGRREKWHVEIVH